MNAISPVLAPQPARAQTFAPTGASCRLTLLSTLACAFACTAAHADSCPGNVPQGLHATPVGEHVIVQGLDMAVAQVDGKEAPDTVLTRTAEKWAQDGFQVKRNTAVGYDIVAARGKGCLVTLQLAKRKDSFGYLARSSDKKVVVPTAVERGVKLPPDAVVASSVASNDDGRQSLVLNMTSQQSLEQLRDFFMRELAAADWRGTRAHTITHDRAGHESMLVTAQKDRRQVEIVIRPERGSQIVMTIAEAI